ncbi:MAG: hypothetical protein K9J72_00360 [Synechococcus sp. Tobar2m-G35]|nr:hypothetical protein [Synechococcus sp. Tobar2m-G35]
MVPLPPPLLLAADLAPVDTESWGGGRLPGGLSHPRHSLGRVPGAGPR